MRKITLKIDINDQTEPTPDGKVDVFTQTSFSVAGVGPSNLAAFQDALLKGGADFLESVVKVPGQVLAMLGLKTEKGGSH